MESLPGHDAWKERLPEERENISGTVVVTIDREDEVLVVHARIHNEEFEEAWHYGVKPREMVELTEEEKCQCVEAFFNATSGVELDEAPEKEWDDE